MRARGRSGWYLGIVATLAIILLALAHRPALPVEPDTYAPTFEASVVAKGSALAAIGNCMACHTAPGGRAFAGGLAMATPFGTIRSTNITPDPRSGIGLWSEVAFRRALQEGVGREGQHLYPAFPYEHFTRITDEDCLALYAFLMTRPAVMSSPKPNNLIFPLQFRPLLAGWKALYFRPGRLNADRSHSESWNRGRYLAEGLGHCGSCHTPRNALGAEIARRSYAGGEAEGWVAYPLDATNPAPVHWTGESLNFYLRNGWHPEHGVARGPMSAVTGSLSQAAEEDIAALASYVVSLMGTALPQRPEPAASVSDAVVAGESIYAATCAPCHESGTPQPYGGLDFSRSTAVNAENPQNIINVTLFGLPPADGETSAVMPSFASALTDDQIVNLLMFLRRQYSGQAPWPKLQSRIANTRNGNHVVAITPADGIQRSPRSLGMQSP